MVSLAIQRGFAAMFVAIGPLLMLFPEGALRMTFSNKTLQIDEVHLLLMGLAGLFSIMLGVLIFFANFNMGTWRAFGAILLIGAVMDMYTFFSVPSISPWVPLTDMCSCFFCYGLVHVAIKEIAGEKKTD